ncbi:MAG: site-2 protease family protein [Planctomycetota bacterium]
MLGSWKISRLFGIDIRIHWTFVLLLAFLLPTLRGGDPVTGLFAFTALFGSVLLHELGHSLMAKRFGVEVIDITFWPLGGMARMTEIPEEPRLEGLIAIAGPAVNFLLLGLCVICLIPLLVLGQSGWLVNCLGLALVVNAMLGIFNLVPAFPMDGGRLLRAFLARTNNYVRATELAVRAGRFVAVLMVAGSILASFFGGPFCVIPLIALFIWYAGGRELMAVRVRHGLSPLGGRAPFGPRAGDAGGFGQPEPRPAQATSSPAPERAAPQTPDGGARRPEAWDNMDGGRRGFSEDEIRQLERYRGRLQRPDSEAEPPADDPA